MVRQGTVRRTPEVHATGVASAPEPGPTLGGGDMADNVRVNVTVNGEARESEVEPRLLLVHYLRDTLGLTGTHIGCDTSNCGAYTVLLDGVAEKSCTGRATQAGGSCLKTSEGMS